MPLEDYLLARKVGQGGAGTVFKAYDRRQARVVALKLTHRALEPEAAEHLGNEVNALRLDHPNILKIERLERLPDGRLLIVMPFVAGRSLEKLLIPLPFAEALSVACQVAEGLGYAHRRGVLHCDIKPANLIVAQGHITILDFGLSRLIGDRAKQATGTLEYLAPEAARGQAPSIKSDLWSLGVVLYELLTGRLPFLSGTDFLAPSRLRLDLPNAVDAVVERLLGVAPLGRYSDAGAVLRDLRRLETVPPPKRPSRLATRLSRVRGGDVLPPQPKLLLGRENEVALLSQYLGATDSRLVTLQGVGGVGKTHLASWVAHEQRQFAHVHFAALAEIRPKGVWGTLGNLLGVEGESDLEAVRRTIGSRSQLLILDNFEHLASQAAQLETLLAGCPRLSILVTSRERLGLDAEWVLPVQGLTLPLAPPPASSARDYAALALLEHRAKAVNPSFDLLADLASAYAICAGFEGHPLGIALAASLLGQLSTAEVAARLKQHPDLPEQGTGRHRSLHAVFQHSYDLLPPELQSLLGRLSIFAGGFGATAAHAIAGADGAALQELLGRSLLEQSLEGRYRQHPVIHTFCKALPAARDPKLQARYQAFYLQRLRDLSVPLKGIQRKEALERLAPEIVNLSAAIEQHPAPDALLGEPLRVFYTQQGRSSEGWDLFRAKQGPYAAASAGWFALLMGDAAEAEARVEPVLAAQDEAARLLALNTYAGVLMGRNDLEAARRVSLAALELAQRLGDAPMVGACLSNLALLSELQGDIPGAISCYRQSLDLSRAQHNEVQTLATLNNLAVLHLSSEQITLAKTLLEQALVLSERTGLARIRPMLQCNFGLCLYAEGEFENAEVAYREAYAVLIQRGDRRMAARVQAYLGQLYGARGHEAKAQRWLLRALRGAQEVGDIAGLLCAVVRIAETLSRRAPELAASVAALVEAHPLTEYDDHKLARRLSGNVVAPTDLDAVVNALLSNEAYSDVTTSLASLLSVQGLEPRNDRPEPIRHSSEVPPRE